VTINKANLLSVLNKQARSNTPPFGMNELKWLKGNMRKSVSFPFQHHVKETQALSLIWKHH
jgi:hypothetical protein